MEGLLEERKFRFQTIYWLQSTLTDLVIPDLWFLPTEFLSDFVTPHVAKLLTFLLKYFMGQEELDAYKNFVDSVELARKHYGISATLTFFLELDPTGTLNNTLGILINPYSIHYYGLLYNRYVRK